jgi:hypothetical protein
VTGPHLPKLHKKTLCTRGKAHASCDKSESITADVDPISASKQNVPEGNVCVEGPPFDQLDEKNAVLYAIDGCLSIMKE